MSPKPGDASRDAILAVVKERRGLHKSELGRMARKGWGNVGYHIGVLEDQGLVVTETHGRLLWVFDASTDRDERDMLVATRHSRTRTILEAIGLRQRVTIRSLSEELAVSKKVIRIHLSVLQRARAVRRVDGYPPTFEPLMKK